MNKMHTTKEVLEAVICFLQSLLNKEDGTRTTETSPEEPQTVLSDFVKLRGPVIHKPHECSHCHEVGHNVRTCEIPVRKLCPACNEDSLLMPWTRPFVRLDMRGLGHYWFQCDHCNHPYDRETHREWLK